MFYTKIDIWSEIEKLTLVLTKLSSDADTNQQLPLVHRKGDKFVFRAKYNLIDSFPFNYAQTMFEMEVRIKDLKTHSFVYPKLVWVLLYIAFFYQVLFAGFRRPTPFDYFVLATAVLYSVYLACGFYKSLKREMNYLITIG
jgi:hypothetical protein